MALKHDTQLTRQIGEHLVTAELGRREIIASPFAGNVSHIDILAYKNGKSIPLQVKAIRGGDWQFTIDKFVKVEIENEIQILGAKHTPNIEHLLCIFVLLDTAYGKDKFFIFEWEQLQNIAETKYRAWLVTKGGRRPRNQKSLHCSISPNDLAQFEGKWKILDEKFN
jgi:hypothetical protein